MGEDQYFYFGVSEYGGYSVYFYQDGDWSARQDWVEHPAVKIGGTNHLAVRSQGLEYTFFINDQYITHTNEDRQHSGAVGLAMELYEPGVVSEIQFDDFVLYTP